MLVGGIIGSNQKRESWHAVDTRGLRVGLDPARQNGTRLLVAVRY
jgi:hypothetical protein